MNPLTERARSDDGYRLWLRYQPIAEPELAESYRLAFERVCFPTGTPTLQAAADELSHALSGMLGIHDRWVEHERDATLLVGTPGTSPTLCERSTEISLHELGQEGYAIHHDLGRAPSLLVAANSELGVLYGVFALLRQLQQERALPELRCLERPRLKYRMLNHWDNLDRTIERGYAGMSLWDWHKLPDYVSPRLIDYARANASVGINAVSLTNVNANALVLTSRYLTKVRALADVMRPYGIRIFLTARFSAPTELARLATSDPSDAQVVAWWRDKVREIYQYIPDFGGFVVKANSEGQPGPQDYGKSQAEGANLLAQALLPYGGIVVWRAFVYDDSVPVDRHKQAYNELVPLDGQFAKNVCLQVKNGPIDFQPREPFHPLFGAMPNTPLFMEFQITQEYLGFATHLCYLAPLFKETLDADTHAQGLGSTVSKVVCGELGGHELTGMAGVSNIGDERNWCGHPFAAANWYAFARLAWNPTLGAEELAEEWLRMTFSNDANFVQTAKRIMLESREAVVEYMTPLGLHHLMACSHHYGPGPWVTGGPRSDWTSTYYHRADRAGIGFDRTRSGSNALAQYQAKVRQHYEDPATCPEQLLLWFHHVPWDWPMASGNTLWEELCHVYTRGVERAEHMQSAWLALRPHVDAGRFDHVRELLAIQVREANWWRNACLLYFQGFSGQPFPANLKAPVGKLADYVNHEDFHVPGI